MRSLSLGIDSKLFSCNERPGGEEERQKKRRRREESMVSSAPSLDSSRPLACRERGHEAPKGGDERAKGKGKGETRAYHLLANQGELTHSVLDLLFRRVVQVEPPLLAPVCAPDTQSPEWPGQQTAPKKTTTLQQPGPSRDSIVREAPRQI